jgi:phospholipase C
MKFAAKSLLLIFALAATLAYAQVQLPHFDNIIIVFQENRTPDNLFGSSTVSPPCGNEDAFEPGVDIQNCYYVNGNPTYLTPLDLTGDYGNNQTFDPQHNHYNFTDACHIDSNGVCRMDGFCSDDDSTLCFTYVPEVDVDPYFQIAKNYGFANYMFQTNEGPSYPAHQFIISGTSAPTQDTSGQYNWFAADNTTDNRYSGCTDPVLLTPLVDQSGTRMPR